MSYNNSGSAKDCGPRDRSSSFMWRGPCDVYPSVVESYSNPVTSPMCDEYFHVLDDIRAGLQYVFQTKSKLVLAISGAGHSGMEAVITNLVGPGETLLIAARGMWDERAFIVANRYGINVEVTRIPLHATFKLEDLEPEIRRLQPTALFITHGDSSTGTVQKIPGLGDICHDGRQLDLVSSVRDALDPVAACHPSFAVTIELGGALVSPLALPYYS